MTDIRHERTLGDPEEIINEYREFSRTLLLGCEAAGIEPPTEEEIDRAFTVSSLVAAHGGEISEDARQQALELLRLEGVRARWTAGLFDAAVKLCAYITRPDVTVDPRPTETNDPVQVPCALPERNRND